MEQKLFSLLVEQDEISWKSIIYDLVQKESMDPWDINVSNLANLYLERVKTIRVDLKTSGKVVLAAAILLRIKSKRLVGADLNEFDRLLASGEEVYDELEQQLVAGEARAIAENVELVPRTPQLRPRKVSVYDLVRALEKALEVKKRRLFNQIEPGNIVIPTRTFDIGKETEVLYQKIVQALSQSNAHATFSSFLPVKHTRIEKIFTFIPLLHLSHQQKIVLSQQKQFGEIFISLEGEKHVDAG
ncbi:MAG: segregation/condensation protein A [Candidatus Aenigmarchaeota archaeon]|nr:segregation/condensation protein A [Candidatus Aenigmarchaeota archaeon]